MYVEEKSIDTVARLGYRIVVEYHQAEAALYVSSCVNTYVPVIPQIVRADRQISYCRTTTRESLSLSIE